MNKLITKIMNLFAGGTVLIEPSAPKPKKPRWRLEPDECGTYSLQEWNSELGMYLTEAVRVTEDDAPRIIASLEREHIYVGAE